MTFKSSLLLLTALFAMFWAILRACVQSLTIDEADTYLGFASRSVGLIWYPSSNNHVLNSLLIWITTCLLGASSITVRIPALAGAALYICVLLFPVPGDYKRVCFTADTLYLPDL